ncbi:MAG: methyltransferase domain-containing protein [Ilumatobacteraceae bacterium]
MRGYDDESYGEAFADVYDDWYHDVSDVDTTIALLARLAHDTAGAGSPTPCVVELGVGTGRLAIPLAALGVEVTGVDTSRSMLDVLASKGAGTVHGVHGDMVGALAGLGPAHLVFVAYNTLFSLLTAERQQDCFHAVAAALVAGGRFVVEAFVPPDADDAGGARRTGVVGVRSLAADRVVLSIDTTDPASQRSEGQYVEFTESGGVRLRPWSIRWSTPAQLDDMATRAGLRLEHRWADPAGTPFDGEAERHVSVYRTG